MVNKQEQFVQKARKVHGDKYDYSLVDYKHNHGKIMITCPIHGDIIKVDAKYGDGRELVDLGMKLIREEKPSYCYVKRSKIFKKSHFNKRNIKNKLETYDLELTVAQNMFNNGYRRLWDAGSYIYEWRK